MKMWCFLLPLVCASVASGQVTAVGPFSGAESASFGTRTAFQLTPCVVGRVFNHKGDLCTPGNSGAHITSGWSFMCQIGPHTGTRLFGSAGGFAEYTFDTPAQRFGGFFGTNCGTANATANFFDAAGNQFDSELVTIPANCTWTWNGWDAGNTGPKIKRVQIIRNAFGGAFIDMDSMELDTGPVCPAPFVYCTAKVN